MKNELNSISTVRQKRHDLSRFVAIDVLTFAGLMPYAYLHISSKAQPASLQPMPFWLIRQLSIWQHISCCTKLQWLWSFHLFLKMVIIKVHIFWDWRPKNFARSPPYFWLAPHSTKVRVEISQNFVAFNIFFK